MKHRIYAFTLIELLVVISIIALLVAILLPALGKARTLAKFTLCSSQEHQVGIGEHLYAADNSSRFTPGNAWNSGTVYVGKNYGHVGAVNHGCRTTQSVYRGGRQNRMVTPDFLTG